MLTGSENAYKQYINQYTSNALALNRTQHALERDKRRQMSHKFSLTSASDFSWRGSGGMGNAMPSARVATLVSTLLALEAGIHAPFIHPDWAQGGHRARWIRAVGQCSTPEQFGMVMSMIEACIKPVTFNQVWTTLNIL